MSIPINKYEYPSGNYICSYSTVTEAANDNNVSNDVISLCVRGAQLQSGGYTYRNANKFPKHNIIIQIKKRKKIGKYVHGIDMKTNEIVYMNTYLNDLKNQGFHTGHICECCKGKRKSYKGLYWKYADEQFEKYFNGDGIVKHEQKSLSEL